MKLDSEFVRLPYTFDADRLREEVSAFKNSAWMPHPQQYPGNFSIPLISVNGQNNDDFNGPMQATDKLKQSPYLQQVIASFGEVFGRSRLMRLDAKSEVPQHADINYHWYNRVRIHIPITTNPDVTFFCGTQQQKMTAGECWLLDTWKRHWVTNDSQETRIHLVIDTTGSAKFWNMVSNSIAQNELGISQTVTKLPYLRDKPVTIHTEQFNAPGIMSPGEIDGLVADLIQDAQANQNNAPQVIQQFIQLLNNFRWEWRKIWAIHGPKITGFEHYRALRDGLDLPDLPVQLASNEQPAMRVFYTRVLVAVLNEKCL